jgi:hypothetical protein
MPEMEQPWRCLCALRRGAALRGVRMERREVRQRQLLNVVGLSGPTTLRRSHDCRPYICSPHHYMVKRWPKILLSRAHLQRTSEYAIFAYAALVYPSRRSPTP